MPVTSSSSSFSFCFYSILHPLFCKTFAFVAIKINLLCNNHGFITRTASPCSTFRHITFFLWFLVCTRIASWRFMCLFLSLSIFFFSLAAEKCRWELSKKKKTFLMVSSKSNWVTRKYTVEIKKLQIKNIKPFFIKEHKGSETTKQAIFFFFFHFNCKKGRL